jgi:hypothetical protein
VGNLDGGVYSHDVIIHEENFVDRRDPDIHTQSVEGLWSRIKSYMRRTSDNKGRKHFLETYLAEYINNKNVI